MATRTVEMEHKLEQVFLTVEDHIGILTLHNPPVNAASGTVQEEIIMLCDYINHDDDIWVCIMHSDLKTFCVGVDIKRFKKSIDDKDVTNTQEVYYDGALALYELRVPLICAVHGHCLGGGLCYPAGADITIAVKGTVFGAPEAKLSVVGGSGHLARILPPQIQRDMCYCGTFITAEELTKYGGVTKVVDTLDDAMKRLRQIAPLNAMRVHHKAPCVETGKCMDCQIQQSVCNSVGIINHGRKTPGRFTIIMIADEIGF